METKRFKPSYSGNPKTDFQELANIIKHESILDFRAYLDTSEISNNYSQLKVLFLANEDDLNLLMIAAKSGKIEIVKFLLDCGLRINLKTKAGETAADFAWTEKHFEILFHLLNADSLFPQNFNPDFLPADNNFAALIEVLAEDRKYFHEYIKREKLEQVQKFFERNPAIKFGYNSKNQSAIMTAVQSKSLEIYSFLRSKGFQETSLKFRSLWFKLSVKEKQTIRQFNLQYFQKPVNLHIMDLLSHSRLGFGNDPKNVKMIENLYESVDEIEEVQPILKTVANSKASDIIFDFNSDSVHEMDATKTINEKGTTYYESGRIYIGAKSKTCDTSGVQGTLVHEMSHHALFLTYDNKAMPFRIDDEMRENEFRKITKTYKKIFLDKKEIDDDESTIARAFKRNELKPSDVEVAELAVRVPHLYAKLKNNPVKLKEIKIKYPEIFNFHQNFVIKDMQNDYPVMKAQRKIQELNRMLKVYDKLQRFKIVCAHDKMKHVEEIEIIRKNCEKVAIITNVPWVALANFHQNLTYENPENVDKSNIFVEIDQLSDSIYYDMIKEAFFSEELPTIFVIDSRENSGKTSAFSKLPATLNITDRIILIAQEDFDDFDYKFKTDYNWEDLHEKSREEILNREINFQGNSVKLFKIISKNDEILKFSPLQDILNLHNLRVKSCGDRISSTFKTNFYVAQKFRTKIRDKYYELSIEELLDRESSSKTVIIAGSAGTGKTTTLPQIAEKIKKRFPEQWINLIDLKKHTKSYKISADSEITPEFITKKLLHLKSSQEKALFENFFKYGKVIFLLDGFDEISPNFKIFMQKLLKVLNAKNRVWITTRLHLVTELEDFMGSTSINLLPFSHYDQIEFIEKFLDINEEEAANLLQKFYKSMKFNDEDFFGIPLQIQMFADTCEDQNQSLDLNLFEFYENFVKKKMSIFLREKGDLAIDEKILMDQSYISVMQVHEIEAIKLLFNEATAESLELPTFSKILTKEMITRLGIVEIVENQFEFVHQTFAEFCIAKFIITTVSQSSLHCSIKNFSDLLLQVFTNEKCEGIRKFLNAALKNRMESENLEKISMKLQESFSSEELNCSILIKSVVEGSTNLINFLLLDMKFTELNKMKILEYKNKDEDTPLHVIADLGNIQVLKTLWNCVEAFADVDKQKKLLTTEGSTQLNVLSRAISDTHEEIVQEILTIASNVFNLLEFKNFLLAQNKNRDNSLHLAVRCNNYRQFETIWNFIKPKFNENDLKDLIKSKGLISLNVLSRTVKQGNPNTVNSVLRIVKGLMDYDELNSLFTDCSDFGDSVLLVCCRYGIPEGFTALWSFIEENFGKSEQKAFLTVKALNRKSLLNRSAENFSEEIIGNILKVLKIVLNEEEIKRLITDKNDDGNTSLHIIAENDNLKVLKCLWENFEEISSVEEQKKLLLERNGNGKILLMISQNSNSEIYIESRMKKFFTADEIQKIVTEKLQSSNDNQIENVEVLKNLNNFINLSDFSNQKILSAHLKARHDSNDTAFQQFILKESSESFDKLWHVIDQHLPVTEQKNILFEKGFLGRNTLQIALQNKNHTIVQSLWSKIIDFKETLWVKELLLLANERGKNFFQEAIFFNHLFFFDAIEWLMNNFDINEVKKLFNISSNSKSVIIHYVAQYCDGNFIEKFFALVTNLFEPHELKTMALQTGNNNYNILGYLIFNQKKDSSRPFWRNALRILGADDLKPLVFVPNRNGNFVFNFNEKKKEFAMGKFRELYYETYNDRQIDDEKYK